MAKDDNFSMEAEIGKIINKMGVPKRFYLDDIYKYEKDLRLKYPDNSHIKDTIRATLQKMRDKGIIRFLGKGSYELITD